MILKKLVSELCVVIEVKSREQRFRSENIDSVVHALVSTKIEIR